MSTKKRFTPEEIRHLRANPYTRCVTADTISYRGLFSAVKVPRLGRPSRNFCKTAFSI